VSTASIRTRAWRTGATVLGLVIGLVLLAAAWVAWMNLRGEAPLPASGSAVPAPPASQEVVERGAYLARAGNCTGCHTPTGGALLAGGREVDTPFGVVVAANITPDVKTGIGSWTADAFWRSLHHGRSKDGRLLVPACPYPSFTHVTRDDADALYAYLRAVPAVEKAAAPHTLRFPYNTQAALAVWRALYFRPGGLAPETRHDSAWNRGRYLTLGLGHCAACHSGRDALGGTRESLAFAGSLMPNATWYAPSLADRNEAGVQHWPREQVVRLLKDGVSREASVSGPMAAVVYTSTQYLSETDLDAMARYLASIPLRERPTREPMRAEAPVLDTGLKLYEQHCADCHGQQGQGVPGLFPALAGNRAVTLSSPVNVVQVIRHGGFLPTTAGNRQPSGMPPYGQVLSSDELAAVATAIRQSWGNAATPFSTLDVLRVK
jgi:mono/diheme cytochrome c family protein